MREPTPQTIRLEDYTPPAFLIDTVDLDFDIHLDHTDVRARLALRRNRAAVDPAAPLVLDGEALVLLAVALDGRALAAHEYTIDDAHLTMPDVPDAFTLHATVRIRPRDNTTLMGLFASKDGFFTQCEAEGFRRITYMIDRPDVMARYTTTIHADRDRFPVLLSNGNRVGSGVEGASVADGTTGVNLLRATRAVRHWARWEDPFPKPSYLFALVAAKLDQLDDTFVTKSGRPVALSIYVEPGKLDQCAFAMQALQKSMKWDEDVFGLEMDLDHYMIVAVGDFNMGAMENKGLNIFNTKYVLARADTATDADFLNIDRVVAHEYFHNWTGNRVTCRDWFQLSLKEGLTVFRDQEFGADMHSRPVQRIQEVRGLRAAQFPEDAGPMAHPIRPQSYMEISNFYTATVYEKGAEVVRMIHTLLGTDAFRRGMDLYFARHDGQAVTTDDFVAAMADASGVDLAQFKRWYDQAGTPVVESLGLFDPVARTYTLILGQHTPPTPGQAEKLPLHIPFAVGLVGPDGRDMPLQLEGEAAPAGTERVLSLTDTEQRFVFVNVPAHPVPSLLRNFSAPVLLRHDYSEAQLAHLMVHDADAFNRWEAGQRLATNILLRGIEAAAGGAPLDVPESFIAAFARVLADGERDPAFAGEALALPSEAFLAEQLGLADPDVLHAARLALRRRIAASLREALLRTYHGQAAAGPYSPDARSAGKRALRNTCLGYLMELDESEMRALAMRQFETADNMTDAIAALSALANTDCDERVTALEAFYERWKAEPLVVDKWLSVQATSRLPNTLAEVERLTRHEAFDLRNPNKVYALVRGFAANYVRFNAADGAGYAFLADQIIALDPLNPQVAARLARGFDRWRKFDDARQAHARSALERIGDTDGLSKDVLEVVTKALDVTPLPPARK
jgi:aminopeptidase N